mgnify:CR=1 FL=1
MFRPEQKEMRYLTAYITDRNRDRLDVVSWRWKEIYNQDGLLEASVPYLDIIYK